MTASMKAVEVSRPGAEFQMVERPIPEPAEGWVRIRVEGCGICHGDSVVKEGHFPGMAFPRVPGHEVVGRIDELGKGVTSWEEGLRVGVGWTGGHCFECGPCRQGDFVGCANGKITGISHDGGYAEFMVARAESLARVPDRLDPMEAAPLLCAGLTTFNALRRSVARPGDLVAVQGIGGLGHLGVQIAAKSGYRTVAISRGKDKEKLALELGADAYIDSSACDAAEALQRMGGARVILATAPGAKDISAIVRGLGVRGVLVIVGAPFEPIEVSAIDLIVGSRTIQGWNSGHARDSEETLEFCALRGIHPRVEVFPLEKVNEAYQRMMTNKARFRVVLKPH